ncbi:hypothetical protein DYB26_007514, partial [Aphanomyces astaci]
MKILYVTDVEGNWDYFLRFIQTVQTSPHTLNALTFTDASHTRLVLQRGYQFVFGGDVGDKGVGIKSGPHWLPETTRQPLGIIPYLSKLARNGQDIPTTSTDSSSSIDYMALDAVNTK